MLHFVLAFIFCSLLLSEAWAKCEQVDKQKGFPITVNLPLNIKGEPSCYHQSNPLRVKAQNTTEANFLSYELDPLSIQFENIPHPEILHYVHVEDSNKSSASIYFVSFLCSGETPIGGDAFTASLSALAHKEYDSDQDYEFFIATGNSSGDYSLNPILKEKSKIYEKFLEIFEDQVKDTNEPDFDQTNLYIPSVLTNISREVITPIEKTFFYSYFKRTNSSLNGCHKRFREKMKAYVLEETASPRPWKNIEIQKKKSSNNYLLKWSL